MIPYKNNEHYKGRRAFVALENDSRLYGVITDYWFEYDEYKRITEGYVLQIEYLLQGSNEYWYPSQPTLRPFRSIDLHLVKQSNIYENIKYKSKRYGY